MYGQLAMHKVHDAIFLAYRNELRDACIAGFAIVTNLLTRLGGAVGNPAITLAQCLDSSLAIAVIDDSMMRQCVCVCVEH